MWKNKKKIIAILDRMVSVCFGTIILFLLLYGGYSLWDTAMLYKGAFVSDELLEYKPFTGQEQDEISFEKIKELNEDVFAWITVEDTHIDYPIVQGVDNMEYINKDVYGEFSLSGSIFLDYENQPDFSDCYNLIYGHHMKSGAMFGDVAEFVDQTYFEDHPEGVLYLPEEVRGIYFFACIRTDAFDWTVFLPLQHKENLSALLEHIDEKAVCRREMTIGETDRIIALSTCDSSQTNGRIILFGKLE